MLVFNLTESSLIHRGRAISGNGGSLNYPELDELITDREKELVKSKVIAIGELPAWWVNKKLAALRSEAKQPVVVDMLPAEVTYNPAAVSKLDLYEEVKEDPAQESVASDRLEKPKQSGFRELKKK